jgi:transposase, IS6 family
VLRQCKYLNNVVEQEHRFVKRCINPGLGFGAFRTAWRTIQGSEAMHMIRKGQLEGIAKGGLLAPNQGINRMSGLAASREPARLSLPSSLFLQHNLVE